MVGNPLQYSCLENPVDRGARWATVHSVAQSLTWLKYQHTSKPDISLSIMPSRSIPIITHDRISFFLMENIPFVCMYTHTHTYVSHTYFIHLHLGRHLFEFHFGDDHTASKFPGTWDDFLIYICNASSVSKKLVYTYLYLIKYYLYVTCIRIILVILCSLGALLLNMLDLFNLPILNVSISY